MAPASTSRRYRRADPVCPIRSRARRRFRSISPSTRATPTSNTPVPYALLKAVHILLIATWIGVDLGVFSSSFWIQSARYSPEARVQIGRVAALLDMGPRSSLILMLATGSLLTLQGGWGLSVLGTAAAPIVGLVDVLCLVWLWGIWQQYFALRDLAAARDIGYRRVFLHGFRRFDLGLRVVLGAFMLSMGVLALLGRNGLIPAAWLDWKLTLYGLIIFGGVAVRFVSDDFPIALGEIARSGSTPEREARLRQSLDRARPIVLGIYVAIVLIVFLAVAKPG